MDFQRGIFNTNKDLCDIKEMYFRTNVDNLKYKKSIFLERGDFFSTDTYFNSLSLFKIKKHTDILDVFLKLKIKGDFFLKIFYINCSLIKTEVFGEQYFFDDDFELIVPIKCWDDFEDGMIYFNIEAINICEIFDFSYCTDSKPIQNVKLAIVITHFNRQEYLTSALNRIKKELLSDEKYLDMTVIVSDNSQNLEFESNDKIQIYKNDNYGGSGGFSFGLLKANDQGFTHCLFMDDDASTEVESIKRVYDFLKYSKNKNTAVVGAMFYDDEKNMQYEAGAILKNNLSPINTNLDMVDLRNLLINEKEDYSIDYGGWWFFAFPIIENIKMPFPFFVRGDDICFGLMNDFKLISLNGICSWQQDFLKKNSLFIYYQYFRSMLILYYTSLWKIRLFGLIKFISLSLINAGASYRYDLMSAILFAIKDVVHVKNWDENLNMVYKISELSSVIESPLLLDTSELKAEENFILKSYNTKRFVYKNKKNMHRLIDFIWYYIRTLIMVFSFFGVFIPMIFFRKKYMIRPINDYKVKHAFMSEKILLIVDEKRILKLSVDKFKFICLVFNFMTIMPTLILKNRNLIKKYQDILKRCTTEKYWRDIFKMN